MTQPATPTRTSPPHPWFAVLLVVVLFIGVSAGVLRLAGTAATAARVERVATETAQVAAEYAKAYSPQPQTIATAQRPWTFQTLDIPPQGIPVYLYQGWKDFPIGGAITITTPSGRILHDEPGVVHHFGFQPDGLYTIRANPQGSKRSVQLYNRW